jgi:hypothetical protein
VWLEELDAEAVRVTGLLGDEQRKAGDRGAPHRRSRHGGEPRLERPSREGLDPLRVGVEGAADELAI